MIKVVSRCVKYITVQPGNWSLHGSILNKGMGQNWAHRLNGIVGKLVLKTTRICGLPGLQFRPPVSSGKLDSICIAPIGGWLVPREILRCPFLAAYRPCIVGYVTLVWNLLSSCSAWATRCSFFTQKFHRRIPVKSPPSPLSSAVELSAKATDTDGAQSTVTCQNIAMWESGDTPSYSADFQVDHKDRFLYKWFNPFLRSCSTWCAFFRLSALSTLEKSSPSAMWHRDRGWVWPRMPRKIPKMVCQFLATTSTNLHQFTVRCQLL